MRIALSIALALLLVAGLVGFGVYVYNAGVAQGLAQSGKIETPGTAVVPVPYYAPYYWPLGFGCFALFVPLFFLFLFFALLRGLFWRRRWWGGGGPHGYNGEHVPPMVQEWHRKMHEGTSSESTRQM